MQRVWHVNRRENANKTSPRNTECPSRHFFFFQATYFQNCLCVILYGRDCKNSSSFDPLNWSRSMARNSVLYPVTWRRKQKQCPKRCVLKDLGRCTVTTWSEFYDGVVDIWGQSLCLQHNESLQTSIFVEWPGRCRQISPVVDALVQAQQLSHCTIAIWSAVKLAGRSKPGHLPIEFSNHACWGHVASCQHVRRVVVIVVVVDFVCRWTGQMRRGCLWHV